jgi:hypothetical protein
MWFFGPLKTENVTPTCRPLAVADDWLVLPLNGVAG